MAEFLLDGPGLRAPPGRARDRAGAYPWPVRANHLLLGGALLVTGLVAGCGLFRRLEVVGDSMLPTLRPGDRVLVLRPLAGRVRTRPGDVVALADPREPGRIVVKRLAARATTGRGSTFIVLGDNLGHSTDSRHFGPVKAAALRGRVVYRYAPDARRGQMPRKSRLTRW